MAGSIERVWEGLTLGIRPAGAGGAAPATYRPAFSALAGIQLTAYRSRRRRDSVTARHTSLTLRLGLHSGEDADESAASAPDGVRLARRPDFSAPHPWQNPTGLSARRAAEHVPPHSETAVMNTGPFSMVL